MYRTTVNPNLSADPSNPVTSLSNPEFYRHAFRYILAFFALLMILLISTSFKRSTGDLNTLVPEYLSAGATDSLRGIILTVESFDQPIIHGEKIMAFENVRNFYTLNHFVPVWTHSKGLSRKANNLLDLLEHARDYGLEPLHYHLSAIREKQQTLKVQTPDVPQVDLGTELELLMTDAALCFMVNLRAGFTAFDTTLFSKQWFTALPSILVQGISQGRVQETILSVQPRFVEYNQLQKATENFLNTNQLTDQWTEISYPVSDSVLLRKQIKEVLITLGYLAKGRHEDDVTEALKQFQHFHGLEPDGKPGKNTVEALAQSTLYRYRRLALNLDRLRKQEVSDSTMLYVNIPAYRLKIFSRNSLRDTFRIIVGHPDSPTPQLTARMDRIIANPVWYVPKSITMNEILPKIKSDTGYLRRNGFKILDDNYQTVNENSINREELSADNFNYTLRQSRGSDNALGKVKFIFSNPYAVYLHDTPSKALFSKDIRAFSHGCIRVQDPERLASFIVREVNAEDTDMIGLIGNGHHAEIDINATLPIHIRYITCEADETGNLFFYKDIYGLDKKDLEELRSFMGI